MLTSLAGVVIQNLGFLAVVAMVLLWAQARIRHAQPWPGPRPVGAVFRRWLVIIWLAGFALPVASLVVDGVIGGAAIVWLAILPYLLMFMVQIAVELFVWKRWRSVVWVLVPCLFLPWRCFQVHIALLTVWPLPGLVLTKVTLVVLLVLWLINIGVHYSGIALNLRWDMHRDGQFAAMRGVGDMLGGQRGGKP
jgi:hypothetical protein